MMVDVREEVDEWNASSSHCDDFHLKTFLIKVSVGTASDERTYKSLTSTRQQRQQSLLHIAVEGNVEQAELEYLRRVSE